MASLDRYKVSTVPRALVALGLRHNDLVDLVAGIQGEDGIKVTQSEGRILITVNPATLPAGKKGDPGTPGVSPPTTSDLLRGDGSGGFSTAALGAGLAFGVSAELRTSAGTDGAILRNDGAYGFASVTVGSGLTYTGGTLSANAVANTGTSQNILAGNGTGGFAFVSIGSGLSYSGGTLSANAVANTGTTQNILAGNGAGGFANVSTGDSLTYNSGTHTIDTIQNLTTSGSPSFANISANNVTTAIGLRSDNIVANTITANVLLSVGTGSNMMNVAFANITHPMGVRELAYSNLANANIEQFTICNNGSPENRWWPTWSTAPASPIPKILTITSADY